jgi:hypothetical protein
MMQATSTRGAVVIGRALGHFAHVLGNGRAIENARRSGERERLEVERIEALARRLGAPAPAPVRRLPAA